MVRYLAVVTTTLLGITFGARVFAQDTITEPSLAEGELGSTPYVHAFGSTLLAGQPSAEDFEIAKRRGIKSVITLRRDRELDWNEEEVVRELGLEYRQVAFGGVDSLVDEIFDKLLPLMADPDRGPVLLHCKSANRVGAIWLAHRVMNDGIAVEAATEEARTVGLRTRGYEEKAIAYVNRRKSMRPDTSVIPGINDRFLDPALDVSEWLGRFEIESREVYSGRERVLAACRIKPGMTVADIGAGTGFYSRLFSEAVGESGWVFAVDIAAPFLKHINEQSGQDGIDNITTVLCTDRSATLPPESIDVVFTCDTYHHFEYPMLTLASIHRALKPGGTLVVVDFNRIPGESREFILGHVRAGKEVFQAEIVEAGFHFLDEVQIPTFVENYLLRFRKE